MEPWFLPNGPPDLFRKWAIHEEVNGCLWLHTTEWADVAVVLATKMKLVSCEDLHVDHKPTEEFTFVFYFGLPKEIRSIVLDAPKKLYPVGRICRVDSIWFPPPCYFIFHLSSVSSCNSTYWIWCHRIMNSLTCVVVLILLIYLNQWFPCISCATVLFFQVASW